MQLISKTELTTQLIHSADDQRLPLSKLIHNGQPVGVPIEGAVFEACVRVMDSYVLFMTDDIPSEDTLRIYRFDAQIHTRECVTLGAAYSTGAFVLRQLIEPDQLTFNFFGGGLWRLRILAKPQLHFPFLSDPKGVSRSLSTHTYLKLEHPL
ncbi:MAG TPA: hypothetical protein VIZ65_03630 [Cellvibrionaceae bacterium]